MVARQVTSELSDKPVTNDQGLTAATGDQALTWYFLVAGGI
jgi:hypothetical protein